MGGTILIALSWLRVVPYTVGMIGFGIALVGCVIGWGLFPPKREKRK
jgi:hypothetical protein